MGTMGFLGDGPAPPRGGGRGCPPGPPPPPPVTDILSLHISRELIDERVAELAQRIDADYRERGELVLVGVLKGSFIFLADLVRHLTIPHRVEFIAVSSYGDRERTESGAVRLVMGGGHGIAGRPGGGV